MLKPLCLFVCLAVAPLAWADSFTSSASSLASESVGSLSDSVSGSSNSSSGDNKKVAAGAYTVVAVAQVDGQRQRLLLEPAAGQTQGFALTLPQAAAQGLHPGSPLWVAERAYGLAFARQADAAPFYLAVDARLRRDFESVKL
jgi:hypothetical protein